MLKRWLDSLKVHKMPKDSFFYDRVIPALFIVLGIVMLAIVIYAVAILFGVIPWS